MGIRYLSEAPSRWWKQVPNDVNGHQYMTPGHVLGKELPILLDTGAAVNSVTEEVVVGTINRARARGLRADHEDFPVAQFEEWAVPGTGARRRGQCDYQAFGRGRDQDSDDSSGQDHRPGDLRAV